MNKSEFDRRCNLLTNRVFFLAKNNSDIDVNERLNKIIKDDLLSIMTDILQDNINDFIKDEINIKLYLNKK